MRKTLLFVLVLGVLGAFAGKTVNGRYVPAAEDYDAHDNSHGVAYHLDSLMSDLARLIGNSSTSLATDTLDADYAIIDEMGAFELSGDVDADGQNVTDMDTIDADYAILDSIGAFALFGNVDAGSQNITDIDTIDADYAVFDSIGAFTAFGAIDFTDQNMTNVDIDGGAIDGTAIGAAARATIAVTTIQVGAGGAIDSLNIIDGTNDTLIISIGAKTWRFLPDADQ